MERPLFLPVLSAITGLTSAGVLGWSLSASMLLPLLVLGFLAIFIKHRFYFLSAVALLCFCWGNLALQPYLAPQLPANHIVQFLTEEPLQVEGIIDSRPEVTERGSRVTLQTERIYRQKSYAPVTGRLILYIGEGKTELLTGDRVLFTTRLRRPRNFGLPGEFDYVRHLAYQKLYATAFVKRQQELILIREGADYRWQRRIDAMAARIGSYIGATIPGEEGGILRALLLGERGYVSKATTDAYSRTGVNHILSISGFHIGIIALCLYYLLLAAASRSEWLLLHLNLRRILLLATFPVIVFYLLLSGAAPATTRSVIMIGAYLVALLLERQGDPLNSLLLAALVILGLSPPALFDISFQLSFLALWGIVLLTPLLMQPFASLREGVVRKLLLFLLVSAAATAATIFPVAYYFHRTTATGLLSNFFIVPLMGYGAVVAGFAALPFIGVVPLVAKWLLLLAALLVKISNYLIYWLAKLPLLPFWNPSRLDLLLFYLFLTTLTFVKNVRVRWWSCALLAALFVCAALLQTDPAKGSLQITFFSVGQGEASLITFPDGRHMLVDGGGSPREGGMDVGERLLAPALWRMGVDRLDYLVLSHPHPDHLQGLLFIVAHFPVGEFWESGCCSDSADYLKLRQILAERQVQVRRINAATSPLTVGGVTIEPLAPAAPQSAGASGRYQDANEESLVFRLVCDKFKVLFTGDIGAAREQQLLQDPGRLACTVLKVPHHGSRFSSSVPFLAATSPEVALISAGYRNSMGLPAGQTLGRLKARHTTVFRTDLDGTVEVRYDLQGYRVSTFAAAGYFR